MTTELILGADIGGTAVKYVVLAAEGDVVAEGEIRTDPADPVDTLRRLAAGVAAALPSGAGRLAAAGLACAGIMSEATGRLGRSPNLPGWQNRDLGTDARAVFRDQGLALANDVNAAAYGEWRRGAGRGATDLVMIALGTGVGGGVVCGGRLHLGARQAAGEIGHTVLDPEGPLCNCGNRGCLEAYAGASGIARRAALLAVTPGAASPAFRSLVAESGQRPDAAALHGLARAGDATAIELFAWAGRHLGQAVANCVNLLDPDLVIVGGGVARAGDFVLGPCRERARGLIMAQESRDVPIVPAALGPQAAALGAAELARDRRGAR